MPTTVWLPTITALLALVFAVALLDQWRERRQPFQIVWAPFHDILFHLCLMVNSLWLKLLFISSQLYLIK
jgi:hypothetical protein